MHQPGPPDPRSEELRTEPISAEQHGVSPPLPPEDSGAEDSGDLLSFTWKAATVLMLPLAIFAAVSDRARPPIDASFETSQPSPGSVIELTRASLAGPIEAKIGSFGLSQIPPMQPPTVGGRGKRLLVRLRVSRDSCGELEARIGGSCSGRPKSPLHAPERFTIRTSGRAIEALVSMKPAGILNLGQNAEPTRPGPPREWSLTESAVWTRVNLRCSRDTQLDITLLPGQAHPECSPDAAVYKLLVVNRKPYLPILSFNRVRTLEAHAGAHRATVTADGGAITLGESEERLHGAKAKAIDLVAADSDRVYLNLIAPATAGPAAVSLSSPRVDSAQVAGSDKVPSWLDRHGTVKDFIYGALGTLLLTVLTTLTIIAWKRFARASSQSDA